MGPKHEDLAGLETELGKIFFQLGEAEKAQTQYLKAKEI